VRPSPPPPPGPPGPVQDRFRSAGWGGNTKRIRPSRTLALLANRLVAAAFALGLAASASAALDPPLVDTISNTTDGFTEFRPRIVGDVIVWQRGSGTSSEIMRWDDDAKVAIRLTNNLVIDQNPETDGIHIVWEQSSGSQLDISVYDMVTGQRVSLPATSNDVTPFISGVVLGWVKMVDADGEVFVSPGPPGGQLTGNALVETDLTMDDGNLVWSQSDSLGQTPGIDDDDGDIAVWNHSEQGLFFLGGFDTDDIRPSIGGGFVVWQAGADGDADIWIGDVVGSAALLYDGLDERYPDTDGSRVVWSHWDGVDFDIWIANLEGMGGLQPLTNDGANDVTPQVEGDTIAWVKERPNGDSEIWISRELGATEVIKRTVGNNRADVEPRISGDHMVYESCINLGLPGESCDIVLVPETAAAPLAALAAFASLARLRRRIA
jgi:hypothetical protein